MYRNTDILKREKKLNANTNKISSERTNIRQSKTLRKCVSGGKMRH